MIQNQAKWGKTRVLGTLAARVLITSLLLLALPLLIHTFFLYRGEYKEKQKELFSTLQIVGESRLHLIEQMVQNQDNFLQLIKDQLPSDSDAGLNTFFRNWAESLQAAAIFYVQEEEGKLVCIASSINEMVGDDFSFLQEGLSLGKNSHFPEPLFYVRLGTLVIATPAVKLLATFQDTTYPIDISFIDKDHSVLTSSDPKMVGKKLIALPITGIPNAYELTTDDYAVILPIPNSQWQLLVDVDKKRVTEFESQTFYRRLIIFLISVVGIGGLLVILLTLSLSKPLKNLCRVIDRIWDGDLQARYHKDSFGFELNLIGEHLNGMMNAILQTRSQKERLEEELLIGQQIQKNLFPASMPHIPTLDIAAGYLSAKEVSGDFYDLFMVGDELFIVVADTAGKGVSACLYSLGIRSLLRAFATTSSSLKETIEKANHLFCQDLADSGVFVTAWIATLSDHKLTFASAGHFPALLRKENGKITHLNTKGMALGLDPNTKIKPDSLDLEKGDSVILYTDGIIEARNPIGETFGLTRLEALLKGKLPPSRHLIQEIQQAVKQFAADASQEDDQTLLVIKVKDE